jgi:hypothetical protein
VDTRPIADAEDMPILYRIVLDRVAELERLDRPRAARFRRAAIRAYSTEWNRTEYGRLQFIARQLEERLERHLRPARPPAAASVSPQLTSELPSV